jgi:hypothetical protein
VPFSFFGLCRLSICFYFRLLYASTCQNIFILTGASVEKPRRALSAFCNCIFFQIAIYERAGPYDVTTVGSSFEAAQLPLCGCRPLGKWQRSCPLGSWITERIKVEHEVLTVGRTRCLQLATSIVALRQECSRWRRMSVRHY